jgi:uncharacterized membrane protein YdbT with pleckstrin-like domain
MLVQAAQQIKADRVQQVEIVGSILALILRPVAVAVD